MAAWRYEISLLVLKKYFTRSLRSLVKYFSTLEEKFRISTRPCNILYIYRLNTKIRSTMLYLSGFELYSRWVPLNRARQGSQFSFQSFDYSSQ